MHLRLVALRRTSAVVLAAPLALALLAAPATAGPKPGGSAAPATDVQANSPQVAGDPSSDTTAVFPTNKQNEPTIAVDPVSGVLIAGSNDEQEQPACGPGPVRGSGAAANDCSFFPNVGTSGVYTSSNRGQTWTNRGLLDDQPGWKASNLVSDGDPAIVFGPRPDGKGGFGYAKGARAYYATLVSFKGGQSPYNGGVGGNEFIAVSWSDDDGLSWSAPVLAGGRNNPVTFSDKEAIVADDDPASPGFGRVYVSWTSFRSNGNGSAPIQLSSSADAATSFSAPQSLTPATNNASNGGRQGSALATGPDGSVYVAFEQYTSQYLAVSRDLGATFPKAKPIAGVSDIADPIPGANFRTDSFPSIATDPRAGSATVYVAWATRTSAGGRIVVSTSTDKGASWGAPVTVSRAAEGYAFFQGLDVAATGRVDLGYQALLARTTTYGTGNAAVDAWFVSKPAGSSSWTAPRKVSTASSDPAASAQNNLARQFWGDYNTVVSGSTTAWFISTDARTGVGCPAVDAYQVLAAAAGIAVEDDETAPAPTGGAAPTAPAPGSQCGAQFGNTDVRVAVVTP